MQLRMQQKCIVSSPFIENKIQLFYQASLSRQMGIVIVRIFNHRGVLRNKRVIHLQKGVYYIFTAEEYIIGLDENHQRVWIVDVRRTIRNLARAVIGQSNGLNQQLKRRNLRFSKFLFDKHTNLIYAVYGGHYIFYFRINHFEEDSEINQHLNGEQSKSISINRIIQSQQSIDKLQIKHEIVQKKNIFGRINRDNNQQQIDKCLLEHQQGHDNRQYINHANGDANLLINSLICLLIREKHCIRFIQMDWNNDKPKSIKEESNVHDFCFNNHWHLLIKLQKGKQPIMRREQREYKVIEQEGRFNQKITLSPHYSIFTSEQNLFIIDPITQTIAGVYHKQWYSVTDCHSIPKSINPQNTLLMVDKPDEFSLRFLLEVYDIDEGEFHNKEVITPLVEVKQGAELQLFLKRNLQKIYTRNALIHPYFRNKVAKCMGTIIQREQEKLIQRKEEMMIGNDRDVSSDDLEMDGIQLGRMFLEKFIMCEKQSDHLLDRLMFSLINSGIKALFCSKDRGTHQRTSLHSTSQIGNIKQHLSTSQILSAKSITIKHKQSLQLVPNQDKQNIVQSKTQIYCCPFTRWNGYFEAIINDQEKLLADLFLSSNQPNISSRQANISSRIDKSESEYSSSVGSRLSKLYDNLSEVKRKLSLLSTAYSRILNFISTASSTKSSSQKQSQLSHSINYYKQRVKLNINRVRSLYLLFDLFDLARAGDESGGYEQYLERIDMAVIGVFKQVEYRRKEIIQHYKMDQLLLEKKDGNKMASISNQPPLLMLHQYFANSQLFAIPCEDITLQLFLEYLRFKINRLEEVAYFYHLVKRQLIGNKIKQSEDEQIWRERHQEDGSNDEGSYYPYVSRGLINFFYLVQSVPLLIFSDSIEEMRKKIQEAARLCMQINCPSFTNYMIQLCALHSLPNTLVNIINSVPVEFSFQDHHQSLNQLSQAFLYRQRLIMVCLLHCAFNLNNVSQYSISKRQILIYQMKRILKVSNKLKSATQFQSQAIKNTLLQSFITVILGKSYYQGMRLLEEMKNQCLTLEEDKEKFKSTVSRITSQYKEQQLKAIK